MNNNKMPKTTRKTRLYRSRFYRSAGELSSTSNGTGFGQLSLFERIR